MSGEGAIVFELQKDPVLLIRFRSFPTDAEFRDYLNTFESHLQKAARIATVCVMAPDLAMPKVDHVRTQARWVSDNAKLLHEHCAALAFVMPSPLMRGALKTILHLAALPVMHAVFRDEEEALAWVREQLGRNRW